HHFGYFECVFNFTIPYNVKSRHWDPSSTSSVNISSNLSSVSASTTITTFSSKSTVDVSSSCSKLFSSSISSNPKSSMSMSNSSNSADNKSKSHSLNSDTLLSASLNALICSSVRSSAMMTGISSIPIDCAASLRV